MSESKLQHELKKKRPFESLEQEAALNLLRTNDQLQIRFTRLFRDFGLTPSQYNVLRILRGEGKPLPILEIAERTITVVPGITGLIDRLQDAGFVKRERCPEDRRVIFVRLTSKGGDVLGKLDAPLVVLHKACLARLSAAEQKTLIRLLEKVRAACPNESN